MINLRLPRPSAVIPSVKSEPLPVTTLPSIRGFVVRLCANVSSHVSSGKVYRNDFRNVTLGTQTTNNNLLLTYNCNDHKKGSISTFDLHAAGGDLADQGLPSGLGKGVKNTANSCNNQTLHQVYKGLSNDFFYFYETGSLSGSCHNIGNFAQVNPQPNGCENTLRNRFTTSVPTTVENLEASLLIINESISSLEAQFALAKGAEKDTLESAIRVYNNYRLNTINDVVTAYLDTMWIDSAASFLKNEGSVESMMMLVNIEMQRDTAKVMDYLEAIRDKADSYAALGDDPRVPEMRAFCNYQEFLLPIVNRTGSYYSLTADEKDTIAAYADSSVAVSANARAIEYFLDEKQPVVQGADLPEMERWANPENTNQAIFEDITLTAVPNPTHGEVEFIVSGINTEKCEVSVTDMQGRVIGTAVVNEGSATFDFSSYPSGVYFGKLLKNGELVGTIKVMNAH